SRRRAGSAVSVPLLEKGQRVDRAAAFVPAGGGPDLEVEVTGGGVSGLADHADRFAGAHRGAGPQRRRLEQGHGGKVVSRALAVDDEVVARRGLVAGVLHAAAAGGDERGAALRHHVLTLMGVTGAGGAEASLWAAVVVRPEDRKGVAVQFEAEAER